MAIPLKSLIPYFVLLWSVTLNALDLTRINLNYQYDLRDEVQIAHRVTQVGERYFFYVEIECDSTYRWQLNTLNQQNYSSVPHDTLKSTFVDTLYISSSKILLKMTFSEQLKPLLIVSLADLSRGIYRMEDISIISSLRYPSFLPFGSDGLPIMANFVSEDEVTFEGNGPEYHVYSYAEDFGPADPAMGMMKTISPNLEIDSSFNILESLSEMNDYFFYLIQEDSLSESAITLLKCPSYYPKFRQLEELIPPLTYITTSKEISSLTNEGTKKTFEDFWVTTYGSKFKAKKAIKMYYDQVEAVNSLFTDYRQGWKTDRGLLYIIFGKPDKVIRYDQKEVWRYVDNIEFEFIRIPTLFTQEMYTLRRDRKYEKIWYSEVGEIRKGF